MEDIKDYLEFKISGLKFDLNMTLENFYNEKGIENFTYPYEIMDEIKNNIIEDGVKDEVETTSIGYKYLIRNFGNKQDESTEFFYFKMMIYLSFCDFYLERNNLCAAIRNLNAYYFNCGVNESKNEKKIQRLQMSDNGSRKGKNNSQLVQNIIKEMLISKVWITREDFYNKVHAKACELGIDRSRGRVVSDFSVAVKSIENYRDYFKHRGKK